MMFCLNIHIDVDVDVEFEQREDPSSMSYLRNHIIWTTAPELCVEAPVYRLTPASTNYSKTTAKELTNTRGKKGMGYVEPLMLIT